MVRRDRGERMVMEGEVGRDSLLALVGVCLGDGLCELHLKLVASQCHLLVVRDEGEQRVEHQVVRQVELGAAGLLAGMDAAVLHSSRAPRGQGLGRKFP